MEELNYTKNNFRAGIISIVGSTNVGKSTLLNNILGEKVSIVSNRAQTTRNLIRAILTKDDGQLVFVDTPGIHKAESSLGRNMNKLSRSSVNGSDLILLILDSSSIPGEIDTGWFRRLSKTHQPCIFALNKNDLSINYTEKYKHLWKEIKNEKKSPVLPFWTNISALSGQGIESLVKKMLNFMPISPKLFPDDVLTDYPRRLNIADVIREKFFNKLYQELPHSLAVWVDLIEENNDKCNVHASIYIERHSQKGIVIGDNGRLIKKVKLEAEKDLNNIYEKKFILKLTVKVEKNWRKNFWILKKLGYA